MMYSSNDPLGGSKGSTSSTTPTPELGVASGVSGMARRRSETVGDATPGAVSPASVFSLEEMGMASVGGTKHTGTTLLATVAGWTTLVPYWVVSWAE
jgi:hypothetical protein